MKNILKVLFVIMLMMSLLVFTACDQTDNEGDQGGDNVGDNTPGGDVDPGQNPGGGTDENPGDEVAQTYKVEFAYSYTTKILNDFGRPTTKKEKIIVKTIEIPVDNNGFTAQQLAEIDGILYHGYGFAEWYEESNWIIDDKANTQMPTGSPYSFQSGKITSDFTLYGVKGNLAGKDATWETKEVTTTNKDGEAIVTDVILYINGSGDMFGYEDTNAIDIPWYGYSVSEIDDTGKSKEIRNYTNITKIVISPEITSIGWNAFNGLTGVKSVEFGENSKLASIGEAAFKNLSALKSIVTPASLVTIGKNAFDTTGLTSVWLNDGLKTIADGAFNGSKGIAWIVLPASVEYIGTSAFHPGAGAATASHSLAKVYYTGAANADGSSILDNIDIGFDNDPLTYKATIYTYVEKTEGMQTRRDASWYYYTSVDANGVSSTQPMAYCLTLKYYLPGSPIVANWVDYVPAEPVWEKNNKTGVSVCKLIGVIDQQNVDFREDNIIYNGYQFAAYGDEGKYTLNGAKSDLCVGAKVSDNMTCTLSRGKILSQGGGIVYSYSNNIISVSLDPVAIKEGASDAIWNFAQPNDTGALWTGAQSGLKNIKGITIEDGVTYIGSLTFNGIINVPSVVIPASVKGISTNAFTGCTNLISIYYQGNLEDCKIYDANGNLTDKTLADADALEGLLNTSCYSFSEKGTSANGNYWTQVEGKYLAWKLDTNAGTLFIGGDNEMADFVNGISAPWYSPEVVDAVTSVEFARNIISLGENVIHEYRNVTSISLPGSVQKIPASSLAGTALVNSPRNYPGGVLIINNLLIKVDAARQNSGLFEIPYDTTLIACGAFEGCDKIEEIYVPLTVKNINQNAFADLTSLKVVYTDANPGNWKSISKNAGIKDSAFICGYDEQDYDTDKNTNEILWYVSGGEYTLWACCPGGCTHENSFCKHSWGEWTIETAPTHTANGVRARQCTNPGCIAKDRENETLLKKDEKVNNEYVHVFGQYKLDNNSHCLTESTMTAKCLYCNQVDTKIIEGTVIGAHNFGAYVYNDDATCSKAGTMTGVCQNENCNELDTKNDPDHPKRDHAIDESDTDGKKVSLPACSEYSYSYVWYCKYGDCNEIFKQEYPTEAFKVDGPGEHQWTEVVSFRVLCKRATLTTPNVYYYTCSGCKITSDKVDGSTFVDEGSNIKLYDWDNVVLKDVISASGKFDTTSNLDKFNYAVVAIENAKKVLEVGRVAGAADAVIRIKNSNPVSVVRKLHVLETSFRMEEVPDEDGFVYRLGFANSELNFFNLYFVASKGKIVVKTGLDNDAEIVAIIDDATKWFDISVKYRACGTVLDGPDSMEIVVNKQDENAPDYDPTIPEIKKTIYYYNVEITIGDNETYTYKQIVDDKNGIANGAFEYVESEISNTLDGAKFYFDDMLIRSVDLNNIGKPENTPEGDEGGEDVVLPTPEPVVPNYTFDEDKSDEDGVLDNPADGVTVTIKDGKKDSNGVYEYVNSEIVNGALNVNTMLNLKGSAFTSSTAFDIIGAHDDFDSAANALYVFQSKLIIGEGKHQLVFSNKALTLHSFALNLEITVDGLAISDVNDGLDGVSNTIKVSGIGSADAFDIRVELYRITTTSGDKLVAKIYVNGEYVGCSDSATLDGKKVSSYAIDTVAVYHNVATNSSIIFDDVCVTRTNENVVYIPEVIYQ